MVVHVGVKSGELQHVVDVNAERHQEKGDNGPHGEAGGAHATNGGGGHKQPDEGVGAARGAVEKLSPVGLSEAQLGSGRSELGQNDAEDGKGFDEDDEEGNGY